MVSQFGKPEMPVGAALCARPDLLGREAATLAAVRPPATPEQAVPMERGCDQDRRVEPLSRCHRRMPVWPSEYRPGCGHTQSPCGPFPTGMRAIKLPVVVSMA